MFKSVFVVFVSLAICGAFGEAPTPQFQRRFRPLPARLSTGFGRQEAAPTPEQQPANSGYNYPKPEYGAPEVSSNQEPPQAEKIEFVEDTETQQAVKPPQRTRVVYVGVPQRQVQFEELVYYPSATYSIEYFPYSAVDVVPVREVAYSTEIEHSW